MTHRSWYTVKENSNLHKTISICSLYIPTSDLVSEKELNNLMKQLPIPFILMEDFKHHSI